MSKFECPRLSSGEMIQILEESQIAAVSEKDLANPTADFVSGLYTKLLLCLDSLQEDQGQVEFAALEQLENPDMHVDSIRVINLCNKIKEVVAAVRCPESFTLRDLIRPDGGRTKLFVSAILNFCLHRETKMELLRPIAEELSIVDDRRKELEAKIFELNSEIANHNEAKEREMPLVHEVKTRVEELRQTIQSLNSHQMCLKSSIRKLKEKSGEMDEKISNAEFALVQSVQENANLRGKIVQSPDKLMRSLEEKKSILVEAKNTERTAMQSFQAKTDTLEIYTKALKKMSKHFAQMQTLQEQVISAKSTEKNVKLLKAKLNDEEMLDKTLEAKLVEQQGKVDQLEELRRQVEQERDLKCEEATKELDKVKLDMEVRRRELVARQRKVEAVVSEVDTITSEINLIKESGAAKRVELLHKSEEIVKEFYEYSNSIGGTLPSMHELQVFEKESISPSAK